MPLRTPSHCISLCRKFTLQKSSKMQCVLQLTPFKSIVYKNFSLHFGKNQKMQCESPFSLCISICCRFFMLHFKNAKRKTPKTPVFTRVVGSFLKCTQHPLLYIEGIYIPLINIGGWVLLCVPFYFHFYFLTFLGVPNHVSR